MAKASTGIYEPNKRVMLKVKHERDCDCVVAGFRWHKKGEGTAVGSLLLGLYDDAGALQHVGVCASFTEERRRELTEFLEPYRKNALVIILGKGGRALDPHRANRSACRAVTAAGARGRISPGNRCGPNWLLRSPTSTCRGAASVIWRSFAGGGKTRNRAMHVCAARSRSAAGTDGDFLRGR